MIRISDPVPPRPAATRFETKNTVWKTVCTPPRFLPGPLLLTPRGADGTLFRLGYAERSEGLRRAAGGRYGLTGTQPASLTVRQTASRGGTVNARPGQRTHFPGEGAVLYGRVMPLAYLYRNPDTFMPNGIKLNGCISFSSRISQDAWVKGG